MAISFVYKAEYKAGLKIKISKKVIYINTILNKK